VFMQQETKENTNSEEHRERWSVLTFFWTALVIVLVAAFLVIILMHKPVWVELETLALVVGVAMTIFYTFILYRGIHFSKDEAITFGKTIGNPLYLADATGGEFGHFTRSGSK